MSLFSSIAMNFGDFFELGALFPMRHLAASFGLSTFSTDVRGAGKLTMRSRSSDASVVRQVFRTKEYDLEQFPQSADIEQAYQRLVSSGVTPIVIDAGANMGASTVWFARRFPKARVIAIEPEPGNAAICRRNIADISNAVLVEAALGGASGSVEISAGSEHWAFQTARTSEGGVKLVTIPDLAKGVPNGRIFLVKIDIEGFEADVFASNVGWLDEAFVVIVEPHDWMLPAQGTSRAMQVAIAARPFEVLISGENLVYVRMPAATGA
jgi:FkbM family methyltransferase